MNKGELVALMAQEAGITKAASASALAAMIAGVTKTLKKGGKVQILGLGTFSTSHRAARTGRNPQTGKAIKISARTVAKFSASKALKEAVN